MPESQDEHEHSYPPSIASTSSLRNSRTRSGGMLSSADPTRRASASSGLADANAMADLLQALKDGPPDLDGLFGRQQLSDHGSVHDSIMSSPLPTGSFVGSSFIGSEAPLLRNRSALDSASSLSNYARRQSLASTASDAESAYAASKSMDKRGSLVSSSGDSNRSPPFYYNQQMGPAGGMAGRRAIIPASLMLSDSEIMSRKGKEKAVASPPSTSPSTAWSPVSKTNKQVCCHRLLVYILSY